LTLKYLIGYLSNYLARAMGRSLYVIKTTAAKYGNGSAYAQALFLAEAKAGKSSFLCASALGVLPWQKQGGVVDRPDNLHVLTFDASALAGIAGFLTKTCRADESALGFSVYNFESDAQRVSLGTSEWDFSLFENVIATVRKIQAEVKARPGVHVVLVSSLTGLVQNLKRAIAGPVGNKKGSGMDMAKWDAYGSMVAELRNVVQSGEYHTFWEAHVEKTTGEDAKETVALQGKTGQSFALNTAQVFRIRRMFNQKFPGSACDQAFLDCKPNIEFIANGRKFNECLDEKETDLTAAFQKLGLAVGAWKPTQK
jgi:hypothetical protein